MYINYMWNLYGKIISSNMAVGMLDVWGNQQGAGKLTAACRLSGWEKGLLRSSEPIKQGFK